LAYAKTVTILYSGETHAALEHCDCPIAPNGGLRRRATVIKEIRKEIPDGEILLLDTGGLFAGGIYDENIAGPEPDRRRTEFTIEAVRKLEYNAVAVADEELAYGKDFLLKQKDLFISANTLDSETGQNIFLPYRIVNIQGIRFGIVGFSPPLPPKAPKGITVSDPIIAAKKVVEEIRSQVDVIVALSPLGETISKKLLQQVTGIDILLNGDEYSSDKFYQQVEGRHFFQFFFQGRSMGRIELQFDEKNHMSKINVEKIPLSQKVPDDPKMSNLLEAYYAREKAINDSRIKLELYVMSHSPNSRAVEAALAPWLKGHELASRIDWNMNFIGDILPDGSIKSLNGPVEVAEDARQLLIAKYLPGKFWSYLSCINSAIPGTPWQKCLGKDSKLIEEKLGSSEAINLLRENIRRAKSIRINTSPMVFINNRRYKGTIHTLAFLKEFCGHLDPQGKKIADCRRLPECIDDNECERPGMLGNCKNKGQKNAVCAYKKAKGVKLNVLYDPVTMTGEVNRVIEYLKKITPGVQEVRIDYQTKEGRGVVARYGIKRIPAYFYDQDLPQVERFAQIRDQVIRIGDGYLLNPRFFGGNRYIQRKSIPGRIDIFTSPLDPRGNDAVRKIMGYLLNNGFSSPKVIISFHHMLTGNIQDRKNAPLGMVEEEEALRRIALEMYHPKLLYPYLLAWARHMDSGYWEEPLDDVWLVPQQIKAQSRKEAVRKRLEEDLRLVDGIEINQPLVILVNNQEVVEIMNFDAFEKLYNRLSGDIE
jgi:hypothetical protein